MLDGGAKVRGVPMRIPLDPILGLVPVLGDVLPLLIGVTMLGNARRLGVPAKIQRKMVRNMILDVTIGVIPLLGDVTDFFFKANMRNLRLIEEHLKASETA